MDWTYNTIWTELLPEGNYYHVLFDGKEKSWNVPSSGSYYVIEDYKPKSKDFSELKGVVRPKYMMFNRSNIASFEGIQSCTGLKRLELHYCIKLEKDLGISSLCQDLEWLHVNMSRNFVISEEIQSLSKLKVLCLNNCAQIESLDFINSFPDLVDLRFVNTNIADGNISQLYDCKNLLNVAFSNKRHFDTKYDEMKSYYRVKSESSKSFAYKGGYVTYKYDVF